MVVVRAARLAVARVQLAVVHESVVIAVCKLTDILPSHFILQITH